MPLEPLPHGAELERLLEVVEIAQYEDFFKALPTDLGDELGIGMRREGGILSITASGYDHPMFNRVMGVGLGPEGTGEGAPEGAEAILARAAAHYRAAGVRRWMLQLLPHVEPDGLAQAAARHGVVRLRGWAKHLGSPQLENLPRSDLRVERLDSDTWAKTRNENSLADVWAEIGVENFGFPAAFVHWLRALHGRTQWHLYLALDGETPVATGALFLSQSEVGLIGQLTFAGTLPEYRRRGAQSALIARRVKDARAAGARWIVCETDEELPDRPNPSTRNLIRLGFPVAFVRANWGPPKPDGSESASPRR
jgi:ribosomal protein S18 acetylase RimI-like enzyme